MVVEVAGVLSVLAHIVMVMSLLVWFGLGMPKTKKDFWARFKNEFLSLTPKPQKARTVSRPVRYTTAEPATLKETNNPE
jgi:hypothetical protein